MRRTNREASIAHADSFVLEDLEERRLLSAGHSAAAHASHKHAAQSVRHVHVAKARPEVTKAAKVHGHSHHAAKAAKHAKHHAKVKKTDDDQTITGTGATIVSTQSVLFATAPAVVQTGLQAQAPSGIRIDPNEAITVQTFTDGTIIYSTDLVNNGQTTHVSVDANGNPSTGPVANPTPSPTGQGGDDKESDDEAGGDKSKHGSD